ncbi:MAG: VWA domain-containing protein [Spirochaetales bacterium]|nr:VWA domain-containing protein [Spirochaetales bacterium]
MKEGRKMKKITGFLFILLLSIVSTFTFADLITISQVDNTPLLINQQIKLYVSVTDTKGFPKRDLSEDQFTIYEQDKERKIVSLSQGVNIDVGVKMLLLLDNSGSMYQDASGKETKNENVWRLTYAKNAILALLTQIKNPADKIGFATFNWKLGEVIKPTNKKVMIEKALSEIERPKGDEGYTEIYEGLAEAINKFRSTGGRKVIILLSDGEVLKRPKNPYYTTRVEMKGAIDAAQKEGISVFTIGLIETKNKSLETIAENSGGRYFPASRPGELENLYSLIRNQILNEYLITYEAGMAHEEKRRVKVVLTQDGKKQSAERDYYAGTIFGKPQEKLTFWMFLAIPIGLLLLWLLSLLKFKNKKKIPTLDVLTVNGKKTSVKPLTIVDNKDPVTIGGSLDNDLTIIGDEKVVHTEAQIEQADGVFTITSMDEPITVNNKQVKKKVLRSGDLIKVGNTTIVFDKGVAEKTLMRETVQKTPVKKTKPVKAKKTVTPTRKTVKKTRKK